ncbi:MAG: hypothetical protein ACYDAK_08285 [Candidatus Limnocylindrales bacterium]
MLQADRDDRYSGVAEQIELVRRLGRRVDADERRGADTEAGDRQRAVRHAAAEAPAPGIVGRDVAGGRAHDDDRGSGRLARHADLYCRPPDAVG